MRDYVLSLRTRPNPQRKHGPRPPNLRTGKPYLAPGYAPTTINHRLTVLHAFYAFHQQEGRGTGRNPVPDGARERRTLAHRNPLAPTPEYRRALYRQQVPTRLPRALSDDLWDEVFRTLTSHRDRALACLLVSSAARAQEALDMLVQDVDWGDQKVRLIGKGSREVRWVNASPDFFRHLALYLTERGEADPVSPLWVTLRQPRRPLTYNALRAVLVRVNAKLGTNITPHDFRHTSADRLAGDPNVTLPIIQAHLRHKHLFSTDVYLRARGDEVNRQLQAHFLRLAQPPPPQPPEWGYAEQDLHTLLGKTGPGEP